jgi:transketolase
MTASSTNKSIGELHQISRRLSRQIIQITTAAGSGHPSSSLSIVDVLTVLYFGGILRHNPRKADWPDRDRLILSKGHAAPGLYVALAEAGYFDSTLLPTLRQIGSPLEGHPNMRVLPGVESSTGSLGQGLSIGLGHALAARLDGRDYRVYVIIGDGESNQGQIWEAAMSAAKYRVNNLTAIYDHKKFQQTGPVDQVMPSITPIREKWAAFNWHVQEIDGHDIEQVLPALETARQVGDRPQVIIADTMKGKGLSPFEDDEVNRKHGVALEPEEAEIALRELDERYGSKE